MDIYWIKDKHRCGPATVPDVISLVQMGEISPDTKGWHAGCKQWMPLRELPALSDFLNELKEKSEQPDDVDQPYTDELPGQALREQVAPGRQSSKDGETPEPRLDSPADGPNGSGVRSSSHDERAEFPLPPLSPEEPGSPISSDVRRIFLPSPGARLMARMIDYALYIALFYIIISLLNIKYNANLLPGSVYVWLPCLLLEGILLSRFGTTPGKALMGIRLSIFGEVERLSVMRACMRSIIVFALGCGLMIIPLMPLTGLLALWQLRRRGITNWDANCNTIPVQVRPSSTERTMLGFLIIFGSFISMSVTIMNLWAAPLIEDLESQHPGSTRQLSALLGEAQDDPQASPRRSSTATTAVPAAPGPSTAPASGETSPAAAAASSAAANGPSNEATDGTQHPLVNRLITVLDRVGNLLDAATRKINSTTPATPTETRSPNPS